MKTDTRMFFEFLLRENRPLSEFLDARFTFLNDRLAKHYGIEGVTGPEFRRVDLATDQRGGVLIRQLVDGLRAIPGVRVLGPEPDAPRTPTVSFAVGSRPAREVAIALARRGVFASSGDFYASTIVAKLGYGGTGVVRAGAACYTTGDEVARLVDGVAAFARGAHA